MFVFVLCVGQFPAVQRHASIVSLTLLKVANKYNHVHGG